MCQLVLEISQFKVIFPLHKDAAIFMISSLVSYENEGKYDVIAALLNYGKNESVIPGQAQSGFAWNFTGL